MHKTLLGTVCACVLSFLASSTHAALLSVIWTDSDGPQWTGVVDTSNDTLTFNSWTENPGGGNFWTPASLPFVWNATDITGSAFDVPDNWNGTTDSTWGFLSPINLNTMSFNEGAYAAFDNTLPGLGIYSVGGTITAINGFSLNRWPTSAGSTSIAFANTVQVSPIPIPPAAWLFGSGLLGLVGMARRKAA